MKLDKPYNIDRERLDKAIRKVFFRLFDAVYELEPEKLKERLINNKSLGLSAEDDQERIKSKLQNLPLDELKALIETRDIFTQELRDQQARKESPNEKNKNSIYNQEKRFFKLSHGLFAYEFGFGSVKVL